MEDFFEEDNVIESVAGLGAVGTVAPTAAYPFHSTEKVQTVNEPYVRDTVNMSSEAVMNYLCGQIESVLANIGSLDERGRINLLITLVMFMDLLDVDVEDDNSDAEVQDNLEGWIPDQLSQIAVLMGMLKQYRRKWKSSLRRPRTFREWLENCKETL